MKFDINHVEFEILLTILKGRFRVHSKNKLKMLLSLQALVKAMKDDIAKESMERRDWNQSQKESKKNESGVYWETVER